MNLNKFTEKAQEVIVEAQGLATKYNHSQIEPEHLWLALVSQADGVVPQIVSRLGGNPAVLQGQLESELGRRPKVYGGAAQVGLSRALSAVLRRAEDEAGRMRDDYVSTEHLLLALTDKAAGAVRDLLTAHGLNRDAILRALTATRGSQRVTTPPPARTSPEIGRATRRGRVEITAGGVT